MAPSTITIDVEEFTRTRDALTTALLALSSSVDRAVKAYVQHSNSVVAGDEALTNAILAQPFGAIAAAASTVAAIKAADEEEVEEGDKKRKRTYKPRDPNAPKRPLTAYFRFLGEMRPLLANELAKTGKHAPGELSKLATERWNAMSQETKQPYHDAYKAAKLNYEKEVEAYKATTGVESFGELEHFTAYNDAPSDSSTEDAVEAIEESISDEEPAPAPAPVPTPKKAKKAASPEATKKAPKVAAASTPAATEKTPKPTTSKKKATATPMFNSINPSSSAPAATPAGKKRKAEAAPAATPAADAESPPKKKKVGRPSLSAEQKALNAAEKKKAKKAEKAAEA